MRIPIFTTGVIALLTSLLQLKEGDLLFCVSPEDNPTTDVTQGVEEQKIDHVAIFHRQGEDSFALEAVFSGVRLTPIDTFLKHNPHVLIGRLRDTANVSTSVLNAMQYLGRPYDFNFDSSDSAIYCSELVQKSYKDQKGRLIFEPIPMSFHDKNGKITPYWKEHYARQNLEVPEGEPGSNPGDLSRNKKIEILFEKRSGQFISDK